MVVLKRYQVESLCAYVDAKVRESGCDHTLRFAREWAAAQSIDREELVDILEQHGGHCDCEVVMNLPEDGDLASSADAADGMLGGMENPWCIPAAFACGPGDTFTKRIVCDARVGKNNHATDGEVLTPAPRGARARKRVRRNVGFFVGCTSGMPTEVGVVAPCPPVSAEDFASQIAAASGAPELRGIGCREAAYFLSKVAGLPAGTTVGVNVLEISGMTGRRAELRIHRVIVRRA